MDGAAAGGDEPAGKIARVAPGLNRRLAMFSAAGAGHSQADGGKQREPFCADGSCESRGGGS